MDLCRAIAADSNLVLGLAALGVLVAVVALDLWKRFTRSEPTDAHEEW